MTESRYASLSGSLLARKGGAKPAMRPRHITGAMLDDLGWNDMGYGAEAPSEHVPSSISALTPAPRVAQEEQEAPVWIEEQQAHEPVEEPQAQVPVVEQQRALADQFPEPDEELAEEAIAAEQPAEIVRMPKRPAQPRAKAAAKAQIQADVRKAAFTLRLDSSRHLRLRLATAVTGRSAQQLVTAALDQFIESLPEVGNLAEQLPSAKRS
ncbi:hypothetical protein [Sphingosinicella sp. YJ22]|uniref:hypothetical protein n=1 Tax=Sphingosinicella sp. YJ22 TaxID=1104780 RepID=UPI00140ACFBF|nr:hypothetical protein [Sphingosinicella sp. YJ22]